MPSRILLLLGIQAVLAVPALFTRERWLRVILVGTLFAFSSCFSVMLPRVEIDSVMTQIRAVTPATLDHLRKSVVDVRFQVTAVQVALCFWLAVLAVAPRRRQGARPGAASETSPPFDPNGAV